MENIEVEKSKAFIAANSVGYIPNSALTKTIVKKATGSIDAISLDSGLTLKEAISPFDTFIHIIDGKAEIIIDNISHLLETGHSIVIPAHFPRTIKANERFKMLIIIIKSGYE